MMRGLGFEAGTNPVLKLSLSRRGCHASHAKSSIQLVVAKTVAIADEGDYPGRHSLVLRKSENARTKEELATTMARVPSKYKKRQFKEGEEVWSPREVVGRVLALNHWEDIDAVLNRWLGRFNRKNFPALISEITRTGAIEHSIRVFNWMKNQKCYRARTDIYNCMIWLHARHQRADHARGLFFEMQEWRSGASRMWRHTML